MWLFMLAQHRAVSKADALIALSNISSALRNDVSK